MEFRPERSEQQDFLDFERSMCGIIAAAWGFCSRNQFSGLAGGRQERASSQYDQLALNMSSTSRRGEVKGDVRAACFEGCRVEASNTTAGRGNVDRSVVSADHGPHIPTWREDKYQSARALDCRRKSVVSQPAGKNELFEEVPQRQTGLATIGVFTMGFRAGEGYKPPTLISVGLGRW